VSNTNFSTTIKIYVQWSLQPEVLMTLLSNYNIMASPKKEVAVKKKFENVQLLNKKYIIHNRSALHELEIPYSKENYAHVTHDPTERNQGVV